MLYATPADLTASYAGKPVPPGAVSLLQQATEIVDEMLIGARYDVDADEMPTDPKVTDALKRATCAQVKFMVVGGDETGALAQFSSVSVGGVAYSRRQTYDARRDTGAAQRYAPQAITILRVEKLLPVKAGSSSIRTY